ncbi:AMP-binding protein [Sulfitobacter geojensis]|uniref:AMP-binding protein n=1 Tax=Sulfitobacter geojensis TaxID=1342299 RepID=UPI00046823AA|nr:AMP-binding protein [Sulfitobacter geojensis]KHA52026.1 AMP-binding domain protein [Sulfitobacter geojensis]NYI29429.1 long-chain acyl-CoA synthetase [Sulfitobacter geojensis]
MNLSHWLISAAERTPTAPALFTGTQMVADYAGFADQAQKVAGWLAAQGVAPGDRVAIFMKNMTEFLVVLYGIWSAGAAAVPINAKLHGREAAFIVQDADAKLVFASGVQAATLRTHAPQARVLDVAADVFRDAVLTAPAQTGIVSRGADDMAWLFYTSGTTGQPKGVIITHGMLASMTQSYEADVDQVSATDTALYAAPLSHGAGLYAVMHVQAGARHVCPASGGFEPEEILELAAHFGSVHMFAAPTMVKRLTQRATEIGARGTGLRTVVYAGGPMYLADIIEASEWFGPVFVQIYGQGECPMGITALSRDDVMDRDHPEWRSRLGSVGRAQTGMEVQICDPTGAPVPTGTEGEIMVRGATVMAGYWRNPAATAAALHDGWLLTGDVGVLDAAGYLTLRDRSKDVIITGGSNVYPREVEEVLLMHEQLREVSVVGQAQGEWGEEVVAFIVGDAAEAELDALCLDHIARFKRPKRYIRLDELPKNNYGKVLKTELRDLLAQR